MNIAVDLIIVLLILLPTIRGYRRGLVLCVRRLICFIGSFAISCAFFRQLGAVLYDGAIGQHVRTFVMDAIDAVAKANGGLENTLTNKPDALDGLFRIFGTNTETVRQACIDATKNAEQTLANLVADPIAEKLSYALSFLLIFLGSTLVFFGILTLINALFRIPGLNAANRILGMAIGLLLGVLYAYVFTSILSFAQPYLSGQLPNLFPEDFTQKTILYRILSDYNFFAWFRYEA